MKAAIHQPQYLPYPGFFHKLSLADIFVIMDDVQYDKRFTNRNRIIYPKGWLWLTVPINKKQKFERNVDVEINNNLPWKEVHWRRLQLSYNRSKFFHLYKDYFENLYKREWTNLFDLNFETLRKVIEWLGLRIEIVRESELNISSNSTQRLVDVCKSVGADTYVAGRGSKSYMNELLFIRNNVNIEYQHYNSVQYQQNLAMTFIPDLSIVDMLANVGPDGRKLLTENTILLPQLENRDRMLFAEAA
jgi:WbqC-like protein family